MASERFEWVIIGGGIAGISLAEILTREGHRVLIVEKNRTFASETTKLFHEWIHTGALYTLVPDRLRTLKYLIGAVDDLLEYYSDFENMNLGPTEDGLNIASGGWFNNEHIRFRYRIRRLNPAWTLLVARSISLIKAIASHDWLRRRAGVVDEYRSLAWKHLPDSLISTLSTRSSYYELESPDFTVNSRMLVTDLLATAKQNGLQYRTGCEITKIEKLNGHYRVVGGGFEFTSENVVVCAGKNIADFTEVSIKTSYAPIAIVSGLDDSQGSFVELDYYQRRCINLIRKSGGIGLAGGISLADYEKCDKYLKYVIDKHRQTNPAMTVLDTYVGMKNEITFDTEDRNYLFHIEQCDSGIWAVVPGKFTLAFSLAPEFYRRMYHRNPKKNPQTVPGDSSVRKLVSDTMWQESARKMS